MSEGKSEEILNEIAKKSKKIVYSTKLFEKTLEESEKPKIIPRELRESDGNEENHKWAIILKYKILEDIPQEVIMGMLTVDKKNDTKENAIEIIKLIKEQLEENANSESGYKSYEALLKYRKEENVPFNFTMEGLDILSMKGKENLELDRTYFENKQGKIECLFAKEDYEKMKETRVSEVYKYIQQQNRTERWNERRGKVLENMKTDEERQKFLKGEEIAKIMKATEITNEDNKNDTEKKIENKRKIVAEYFMDVYDKRDEIIVDENRQDKIKRNAKDTLLTGYLKLKEKGFAIDANIFLEFLERNVYKKIYERKGEVDLEDSKEIKLLQNYQQFFNLVKKARDWNARIFALKLVEIDFDLLERLFEKYSGKDKEILEYVRLKKNMVEETQTNNLEDCEKQYSSVRDLDKFLIGANIRKKTRKDEEYIISGVFEQIKEELLQNNAEEIDCYNSYAEKFGIYVCPTSKVRKESKSDIKVNKVENDSKQEYEVEVEKLHKFADLILEEDNMSNSYQDSPEDHDDGIR